MTSKAASKTKRNLIIVISVLLLVIVGSALPPPAGWSVEAWRCLWVIVLALTFWATESLPVAITGVMVILLLSVFGILPFSRAFGFVADKVIAIMLGGMVLAEALAKYQVDKYLGLKIVTITGEKSTMVLLGIMIATSALSMWIPNTAAAAIMAPLAIGMLSLFGSNIVKGESNLGKAMMIGVAFAATIGGLGTPVGTPPVPIVITNVEKSAGITIGFTTWMIWGVPLAIILTIISWLILTTMFKPEIKSIPGGLEVVRKELEKLGGLKGQRLKAFIYFVVLAGLWISDAISSQYVKDWTYVISLLAIILPSMPKIELLTWKETAESMDWRVPLVFGAGLALGEGMKVSGLADMFASAISQYLMGLHPFVIFMIIILIGGFLTTIFCSITATAAFVVVLAIALGKALNLHPAIMGIVGGVGASFAFLLPVSTPPNLITYAYGYFKSSDMLKAGVIQTVIFAIISAVIVGLIVPVVLGIPITLP